MELKPTQMCINSHKTCTFASLATQTGLSRDYPEQLRTTQDILDPKKTPKNQSEAFRMP